MIDLRAAGPTPATRAESTSCDAVTPVALRSTLTVATKPTAFRDNGVIVLEGVGVADGVADGVAFRDLDEICDRLLDIDWLAVADLLQDADTVCVDVRL